MRCAACHCLSNATALELDTHLSIRATPATQVQKRHILSYIKQYQKHTLKVIVFCDKQPTVHQSEFLVESIESTKRHHILEYSGKQCTEKYHKLNSTLDVPYLALQWCDHPLISPVVTINRVMKIQVLDNIYLFYHIQLNINLQNIAGVNIGCTIISL